MLTFLIGLWLGGLLGFFLAALLHKVRLDDEVVASASSARQRPRDGRRQ